MKENIEPNVYMLANNAVHAKNSHVHAGPMDMNRNCVGRHAYVNFEMVAGSVGDLPTDSSSTEPLQKSCSLVA